MENHNPAPDVDGSKQLQSLLEENEQLIWVGEPEMTPLGMGTGCLTILLSLLFCCVPTVFSMVLGAMGLFNFSTILSGYALLITVAGLVGYLIAIRLHSYAEYAVTDRRLIQFGGFFGRDLSSVNWSNVQDLEVDVSLFDTFFDTGTIRAIVPGTSTHGRTSAGLEFKFVNDPYEVLKTIQDAQETE